MFFDSPDQYFFEEFAGMTVKEWEPGQELENPQNTAYRISVDQGVGKLNWTDKFAEFLIMPGAADVRAFIVGAWESLWSFKANTKIIDSLAEAGDVMSKLEYLFVGDIIYDQCMVSQLMQSDMSLLFLAYPQLKYFGVRGSYNLEMKELEHDTLEHLEIQTGGLPDELLQQVCRGKLPQLKHLELWLGEKHYGASYTLDSLRHLLSGDIFPSLEILGLRDSELADDIAAAVCNSQLLDRIKVLDLSLGLLTDRGAKELLGCPRIKQLQKLNLQHNFITAPVVAQLQALGIDVDLTCSMPTVPNEYRYVVMSE